MQVKWHGSVALPVPGHRGNEEVGVAVLRAYYETTRDAAAGRQRGKSLGRARKRRKGGVAATSTVDERRARFNDVAIKCVLTACSHLHCALGSCMAQHILRAV